MWKLGLLELAMVAKAKDREHAGCLAELDLPSNAVK
jgi:hypothetical protein